MAENMLWGELRPGLRLRGILPHEVVTLAAVFLIGDGVAEIAYRARMAG